MRRLIAKLFDLVEPEKHNRLRAELAVLKKKEAKRKRLARESQARYKQRKVNNGRND